MSTQFITSTHTDYITYLVGDLELPCDYSHNEFCRQGAARWALTVVCPACGFGGIRLAGTDCKDLFLHTEDFIECIRCDEPGPARSFIKYVEAL